jgi:sec-independent protein translocase protein TatC
MSSVFNDRDASDDLFQDTRMSFGDHIEVLRQHLFRAIIWFSIAMCLSIYPLSWYVLDFIAKPVEQGLMVFYNDRVEATRKKLEQNTDANIIEANKPRDVVMAFPVARLREALGLPPAAEAPKEGESEQYVDLPVKIKPIEVQIAIAQAERIVGRPPTLATLNIAEGFLVYFKVAIYCGIVLGSPWIFWELWMFVAAGLYPHEKKYVYIYLPFSLGLFLLGAVFCEIWVIPYAVKYLLGFNRWIGVEPDLRLNEWLSFAIMAPLVFGVAFQTPLVMLFLHKLGIVDVTVYRKQRRMAYFILALIAAFLAAAPDAFNMMMLAIPLWGLYELGILLCHYQPRQEFDMDEPDSGDNVEV